MNVKFVIKIMIHRIINQLLYVIIIMHFVLNVLNKNFLKNNMIIIKIILEDICVQNVLKLLKWKILRNIEF